MKRVKSLIKLTNLNLESLNDKKLNHVIAGQVTTCWCGCWYSECGGSSNVDNSLGNSGLPGGGGSVWPPSAPAEWNFVL